MAYSEYQKERIEKVLREKKVSFEGRKFMGGYSFFVDDKMCVGLDTDKSNDTDRLIARVGDEAMEPSLQRPGCKPMDITGKPLKGFVFVSAEGMDTQ